MADFEVSVPISVKGGDIGGVGGGDKSIDELKNLNKGIKKLDKTMILNIDVLEIITSLFKDLVKLFRPLTQILSIIFVLGFLPLLPALLKLTDELSGFAKKLAAEGGGPTGAVRALELQFEEIFEGISIFKRILIATGAAIAVILLAMLAPIIVIPTIIATLLILAWEPLVDLFNIIVVAWKDFFVSISEAWAITIGFFKALGERIGKFGKDIWNFFLKGLSFISNLGERIWNFIKGSLGSLGGFAKSAGSSVLGFLNPFNDFIQRPGQSPTAFSPNDTIIGVKNPASLSGGAITVNINKPTVRSDSDIKQLANEVSRALQRQMPGRISSN